MDEDRIKSDLDEASERYNEGRYDEAIRLWREVLSADPSNQKAREGIRMASLLTGDWAAPSHGSGEGTATPAGGAAESDEVLPRIEAGITRVRELAAAGQLDEALEGCALLEEIAPNLAEVRRLTMEIREASARSAGQPAAAPRKAADRSVAGSGGSPGAASPERHLETARRALAEGDNAAAAAAARLALRQDPSNMEATGILSLVGEPEEVAAGDEAQTGPIPSFDLEGGPIPIEDGPVPPAAAAGRTAPAAGGDSRIEGLLATGQQAYDAGRYQDATGIWSRIFAIDSTHAEAGARIDRAKAAVEEQARQVDELYYRAVDANEANRLEEALKLFEQVLAISPGHQEARSFIEEIQLRLGGLGEPIRVDEAAAAVAAEEKNRQTAPERPPVVEKEVASVPLADLRSDSPYPPRVAAAPARPTTPVTGRQGAAAGSGDGGGRRLVAGLAGIVVVGAVGVGAWLWMGGENGSMPEARATVPVPVTRPARAPSKGASPAKPDANQPEAGGAPLQVLPRSAPPEPEPAPPVVEPPVKDPRAMEQEGRRLYQQKRWAEAVLTLREAMAADPVDFESEEILDKAMAELEKQAKIERDLSSAAKAFAEKDYATALQKFYRVQQDHPEMRVLDTYIRNCWFDWGVSLMQEGAPDEAVERFAEVLALDPDDREALKAKEFAKRYHGRSRDAVYDAFAASLEFRALDRP